MLMPSSMRSTRMCLLAALLACVGLACMSVPARAQQTRDYMLGFEPGGTFLVIDYFGTGGLLSLEHRVPIYGSANELTLGATLAPAYPLGEAYARADLRILFFGIGTTVAYRSVWRDLQFEPDPDGYCLRCDRQGRRAVDSLFERSPGSDAWPYAELRASLFGPFNEYFVGMSSAAVRYEGRDDRTFDWFYTSVYDRGVLGRWETQFYFKHRDWGGIGPYAQLLVLPRGGEHEAQWAFGFNAVTRLGLLRRDDLLFITVLARPGDDSYGQHSYFAPIRALAIYRVRLTL
jgi:hypothetical protein